MEFESSSAGPSGYGINQQFFGADFPFVDEEEPSTSVSMSTVSEPEVQEMETEVTDVIWQLSPRAANVLNDNVRSFIYNRTDPHIQHDMRSFYNLMEHEEALQPNYHYFTAVQEHVTPFHREQAIEWIYDVAKEEGCDGDVFLLAVGLIDRFLSFQNVLKHDIQMIAGVSLFIASKLKAPHPLTASKIAYYSDNSCPIDLLLQWELLIVHTLQWETESPTAFSFFDQLAARVPQIHNLRGEFQTVVHKCQRMHKLATLFPSMQCAIALYYVSNLPHQCPELASAISNLLASMFQLQVNLLDSYIPMVQRCLSTTPIYVSEESVRQETVAPVILPMPESPKEEIPSFDVEEMQIPEVTREEEISPQEPSFLGFSIPIILEPIPLSEQSPSTPLNDSGFCSDVSSPSSSEKKRRRSYDCSDDDSTPPKVFKFF